MKQGSGCLITDKNKEKNAGGRQWAQKVKPEATWTEMVTTIFFESLCFISLFLFPSFLGDPMGPDRACP